MKPLGEAAYNGQKEVRRRLNGGDDDDEEDDDEEEGSDEDDGVPKKPTLGKRKAPSKPQKPPRKGPEKKARRQYPHFRKCTCY